MTRPVDKKQELQQARELIRQLPALGVLGDPTPRERPDFCLALGEGRRAGLEVVRAIDEGIAAGRGAHEKMKRRLLAELLARGVTAQIVFSITDGAAAVLASKEMKPMLAAEIAAIAKLAERALSVDPIGKGPWRRYRWFDDDILDDDGSVCWRDPDRGRDAFDLDGSGVEFCTAVMVRPAKEAHVGSSGSSRGQPSSIIQDAIHEKAKLLHEYRKSGYDEQWLLVVGSAATGGTLEIDDAEGVFTSPFDRTFFLECFSVECVELRTRR